MSLRGAFRDDLRNEKSHKYSPAKTKQYSGLVLNSQSQFYVARGRNILKSQSSRPHFDHQTPGLEFDKRSVLNKTGPVGKPRRPAPRLSAKRLHEVQIAEQYGSAAQPDLAPLKQRIMFATIGCYGEPGRLVIDHCESQ